MRSTLVLAALLSVLTLHADGATAQSLSGTATYLARVAMPPDAVFEAVLQDVSRTDAPAVEVGRTRIASPGNPPIAFSISYDPALIVEGRSYVVRATVLLNGEVWMTTDEAYPVLTRGAARDVAVTLRMAGSAPPPQPAPAASGMEALIGSWRLTRLGAEAVRVPAGAREPHLVFHAGGRVTGADGCNTLQGLYQSADTAISIGPLVGTLMACEAAGGVDVRFREAIGAATQWKMADANLELLDADGKVLARFDVRLP